MNRDCSVRSGLARRRGDDHPGSTPPNDAMMYFTQWRGRVILIVASPSLMAPLLPLYRQNENALDVSDYPIERDFISVWSGPHVAFRGKVETVFDIRLYHEAIAALFGRFLPYHNWSYPPYTLFAFWPLAQLPISGRWRSQPLADLLCFPLLAVHAVGPCLELLVLHATVQLIEAAALFSGCARLATHGAEVLEPFDNARAVLDGELNHFSQAVCRASSAAAGPTCHFVAPPAKKLVLTANCIPEARRTIASNVSAARWRCLFLLGRAGAGVCRHPIRWYRVSPPSAAPRADGYATPYVLRCSQLCAPAQSRDLPIGRSFARAVRVLSHWLDGALLAWLALRCCSSGAFAGVRVANVAYGRAGLRFDEPTASLRGRQQPGSNA